MNIPNPDTIGFYPFVMFRLAINLRRDIDILSLDNSHYILDDALYSCSSSYGAVLMNIYLRDFTMDLPIPRIKMYRDEYFG